MRGQTGKEASEERKYIKTQIEEKSKDIEELEKKKVLVCVICKT